MEFISITVTEWVGYLASFMVLVSFTMKNIKSLRLVNMTGCVLFIIYGFLMPTLRIGMPIIIANFAIFAVNFYYLVYKKH
jgi:uncharacterized protein with PQ loop repeat